MNDRAAGGGQPGVRLVPPWWRGPDLDLQVVRRLYSEGRTQREIAALLGVTQARVSVAVADLGIERPATTRVCPVDAGELRRLLAGGATRGSLARGWGVSAETAARWLAEAGLLAPDPGIDPGRLRELYVDQRLTARDVAAQLGVTKARVLIALSAAGIGTRPRSQRSARSNPAALNDQDLREVYLQPGMSIRKAAARFGVSEQYLQQRAHALGLVKRRGNHTTTLPPPAIEQLHEQAPGLYQSGWSMKRIATELGVSVDSVQRALHHARVPLRRSGPPRNTRPAPEPVLDALYADPDIDAALRRHHVQRPDLNQWRPSSPWESYAPLPLNPDLLRELYADIGLSITHIKMLCGVGAGTIGTALAAAAIPTRPTSQESPWNQRRHGQPPPPELTRQPLRRPSLA